MTTRLAMAFAPLLLLPTLLMAQTVEVSFGYRHVHASWSPPPAGFMEGATTATFTADVEIDTAFVQPGLVRVDPNTWRYDFAWDATDSVSFHFVDRSGSPIEVRTRPSWPPFEPGPRSVPVVVLDLAPDSLWSADLGIYVWGDGDEPNWDQRGAAWERDAEFSWFDRAGNLGHQRTVGVRINGSWNRFRAQKSFRLYFDHHAEPETIVDDFFGSAPYEHERMILRAGDESPYYFLRDVLATSVFAAAGHERSRWAPVEVWLGHEYWGLYHLRERADDEWCELTLGLSGDYVMIKDGEAVVGEREVWDDFIDEVAAADEPADNEFFVFLDAELDLVSYLDWVLLQAWSASSDNGGLSNLVLIKPQYGRWRFVCYDQDGSFSSSNRAHDFFEFYAAADAAEFEARRPPSFYVPYPGNCEPLFDLWRQLTANPRGRRLARQRWQALNEVLFTRDFNDALLDSIVAVQIEAAPRQAERWDWPITMVAAAAATIYNIGLRQPTAMDHFDEFMDVRMDPVELDAFTVAGPNAAVEVAWHTEREIDCVNWILERRGEPDQPWRTAGIVDAAGGPGSPVWYQFTDTTAPPGDQHQYRLSHKTVAGTIVVHPWLETWTAAPPVPAVVINEFLASNSSVNADETGSYEDWVELYNPGVTAVSLDGFHLTDDLDEPLKWPLPDGLVLGPGDYLLIWCDDDPGDGPLHATFKLSADGESVGVFDADATVIDGYTFGPQTTDVSEGRLPDGGADWVFFSAPTPGASNRPTAVGDAPRPLTLSSWPNPFNPQTTIRYVLPAAGRVSLRVYDLAGRVVRTLVAGVVQPVGAHEIAWDGRDARGRSLASGSYICRITANHRAATHRITLVR
jgi:hypothetical protein